MQNDFIPGGALPVEDGDSIIPGINRIAEFFHDKLCPVILTQDWHPKNHMSFASQHPGKEPGDEFQNEEETIGPVLWPDHCVQASKGAEFHKNLRVEFGKAVIRKGMNPQIDSYSAFLENDKETKTGLSGYLKSLDIKRIFICGLALDYCCYYSAIDGIDFGFKVYFILDLSKGIDDPPGNISNSLDDMKSKGVKFLEEKSF
ncbi:MAG: bifunctional nicotinamidase/pyrazinamidase [Candidatus Lokiarchaeota archaeon]|nr:bifunctional nicotinamidase/pyrazinamidase [Candidatus Lokiarchaeota archaeon]MBD3342304.1 bifunctional nicotinamidase/pyrazinamidase [Candidatus Lokiarchaeota archaeon]